MELDLSSNSTGIPEVKAPSHYRIFRYCSYENIEMLESEGEEYLNHAIAER
jgi:hypothetical protein